MFNLMEAVVPEFDARHVVGDRACCAGYPQHIRARHVEEFGGIVDEPGDEPRTGDAIDFRTFPCNPFHGTSPVSKA